METSLSKMTFCGGLELISTSPPSSFDDRFPVTVSISFSSSVPLSLDESRETREPMEMTRDDGLSEAVKVEKV